MNQIVGYDHVGDQKFPRFAGPCKGCGKLNYGLSTSGPAYCGACARGVDPELTRARQRAEEIGRKYTDALLALSLLTGYKPPFNRKMKWRAEEFIRRFQANEDLDIGFGPVMADGADPADYSSPPTPSA